MTMNNDIIIIAMWSFLIMHYDDYLLFLLLSFKVLSREIIMYCNSKVNTIVFNII